MSHHVAYTFCPPNKSITGTSLFIFTGFQLSGALQMGPLQSFTERRVIWARPGVAAVAEGSCVATHRRHIIRPLLGSAGATALVPDALVDFDFQLPGSPRPDRAAEDGVAAALAAEEDVRHAGLAVVAAEAGPRVEEGEDGKPHKVHCNRVYSHFFKVW